MAKGKVRLQALPKMGEVPTPEQFMEFIGNRYITINFDALDASKGVEGKAQVSKVLELVRHDAGYLLITALVHFKHDERWLAVSRQFVMRW